MSALARNGPKRQNKKHMTDNYWIFKLRIPTLIKILKARNRGTIGTVTYIETTKPASVVLRWFIKHGVFTFPIHQIQQRTGPAGPMFHLSSVRDDKGRVITFDINHHVLELRQEILHHLMKRLKHFHFFTAYRSTGLLAAYLGIQIARDINGLVFMAHYARWKEYRPGSTVETENIYIIPKSEWSAVLKEHFQKMQLRVMVEKRFKHRTGLFIAMAKHLVRSLSGLIGSASHKTLPGSSSA
ncbi:MAG: hypothetical protein GY940_23965, partial [bacterium]|nr:hypothetical protein [bacterium]